MSAKRRMLALSDGWPSDDRVLTLLCEVGLNKSDPDLQDTARQRLRTDPAAHRFLTDRSNNHADVNMRRESVTLIALGMAACT